MLSLVKLISCIAVIIVKHINFIVNIKSIHYGKSDKWPFGGFKWKIT